MTETKKSTRSLVDDLVIITSESSDAIDLSVRGDLDAASDSEFSKALKAAVLSGRPTVNLDLTEVKFLGSGGISVLVNTRQLAIDQGVALRLVRRSRVVERVLDLMNLSDYFK